MVMRPVVFLLLAAAGLFFCACGGPDDGKVDLTPYAGRFDLTEDWRLDQGTQCSDPPTDTVYNRVTIEIEKNAFAAKFDDRWGDLVGGEIHEDTRFLASRGQVDDRIEFSGDYSDEDNFSAIMRDIRQECTRTFDLVGVRVQP
jgi:hypothetical protein